MEENIPHLDTRSLFVKIYNPTFTQCNTSYNSVCNNQLLALFTCPYVNKCTAQMLQGVDKVPKQIWKPCCLKIHQGASNFFKPSLDALHNHHRLIQHWKIDRTAGCWIPGIEVVSCLTRMWLLCLAEDEIQIYFHFVFVPVYSKIIGISHS